MDTTSTNQPTTSQRPKPPPLEPRCPPCSICGEDTTYEDGSFVCEPCGAAWGSEDYHYEPGEWTDGGRQCPWALAYWRDNTTYPHMRDIVYRCLLSEGHVGKHQSPDFIGGWDDKAKNAYIVEKSTSADEQNAQVAS